MDRDAGLMRWTMMETHDLTVRPHWVIEAQLDTSPLCALSLCLSFLSPSFSFTCRYPPPPSLPPLCFSLCIFSFFGLLFVTNENVFMWSAFCKLMVTLVVKNRHTFLYLMVMLLCVYCIPKCSLKIPIIGYIQTNTHTENSCIVHII